MSICKGCQDFTTKLFDPSPLQENLQQRDNITIHSTFTELLHCANTNKCELCKFIRREFYYYSSNYQNYTFSDEDFRDDQNNEVHVNIFMDHSQGETESQPDTTNNRWWQFFLGTSPGPSNFRGHNTYVKDRSMGQRMVGDYGLSLDGLLRLSRSWVMNCVTEHKICGPQDDGNESFFLPKRLLDVGQPGQQTIRLVLGEDLPRSKKNEYVTLSYCWGEAKYATCTTKKNLVDRLTSISIKSMPKTLKDAVEITRALGVRYLWIDALCIIQVEDGVNEDWQHEFPNMGKIYRHSLVTIAASGAKNSNVGCFYRREAANWPIQNYALVNEGRPLGQDNPVILEPTLPNWNVVVEHSALANRGWVLQERMLASRTLFWTEDGLFWNCNELHASEYEAKLLHPNRKFPLLHELVENLKEGNRSSRFEQKFWSNIVEEFSEKALTVATDKLPAIIGLASELSQLTEQRFYMGVWQHNMVQDLAWVADFSVLGEDNFVDPQPARLPSVPSWSWTSMSQKLHFKPGKHGLRGKELVRIDLMSTSSLSNHTPQLRIRGRLGQLQCRQTLLKIPLSYELVYPPTRCTFTPVRAGVREYSYDDKKEVVVFDTLADTLPKEGGTITCIQWMRWVDHLRHSGSATKAAYHRVTGAMIVSEVDGSQNLFRRIGWLEIVDDTCFEEDERSITLI